MTWLKLVNKKNILVILVFIGIQSLAQKTFDDYKKTYPDFNELILNDTKTYDISIENNKIKIIQDNFYESMILNENGINNNKESFAYSDLIKLMDYDAYTVITSNGKEKKIKVVQSNEKQSRENSVFYNDVKERQLIFTNLEAGAKKVYDYQTEFLDYHLLHSFIFGNNMPVVNSTLEVKLDKEINLGYKIFNDPNNAIEFSKTEKRGKWIYKWTMKDIKPIKFEENSSGFLHIIPHINIYIKDYTVNNTKVEGLENVDKLYEYYKGFIKNLNEKETIELKTIAQEITAGYTTDEEKVKAIFYWVKDNIKYIAFENGYEGFIPREGSLVLERKFGDCKDMASIINALAKFANVKNVFIAWIGTRKIPYSYHDLATPAVDNHMIAVYKNGNDYVFLDATDGQTRYGLPTAFIQGKEALVSENDNYKIIQVPIVKPEENTVKQTLKLTISNDKLVGSGNMVFNGYNRSDLLADIGDTSNKARFEMIKGIVEKGSNKFNLINYTEENIKDREKPYIINFNFDLANYIIKIDKEIYVNLFLDRNFEKLTIEKDRESNYEMDFLFHSEAVYELEIPQNYKVKYLPKNLTINNNLFAGEFKFELKDNKIVLNAMIEGKKILLEKSDFDLWNETIQQIKSNYSESIILIEK